MSFKVSSSSISFLFWTSSTATRLSRHFTYSFFRRRHSLAASLKKVEAKGQTKQFCMLLQTDWSKLGICDHGCIPNLGTTFPIQFQTLSQTGFLRVTNVPSIVHMAVSRIAASPALIRVHSKQGPCQRQLLCFMAIKIFEGLEFLNESLVLVFKHSHTIFKTFDIFFLLPATLPGSFPGTNTRQMTQEQPPSTIQRGLVNFGPPNSTANQV